MKAQVLNSYDPDMKQDVWVKEEEVPNPTIEKASDVIVKIGAAGVCRTDYILSKESGDIFRILMTNFYPVLWVMKMQVGSKM